MATTIPTEFIGIPSLSEEKVERIKEWYRTMLGDCDKASEVEAEQYYAGQVDAFETVLHLLYDTPADGKGA
jgi:low affinity Fe/Cu permease